MTSGFDQRQREIGAQLERSVAEIKRRPGRDPHWDLVFSNGTVQEGTARLDGEWLTLDAGRSDGLLSAWDALRVNGALPAASKLVWSPGQPEIRIRSEVWLGRETVGPQGSVDELCASFKRAMTHVSSLNGEWPSAPECAPTDVDWSDLCREAGWPGRERSEGRVTVDLRVERGFHRAVLEPARDGGLRGSVELVSDHELSAESRSAVGRMLLAVGAQTRLVRAVRHGDGSSAALEVRSDSRPDSDELDVLLSSLSTACWLCGFEVEALQDSTAAKQYLDSSGWGVGPVLLPETTLTT